MAEELAIAIDGGTTNTRARLFRGAAMVAAASRAVGVRDVAIGGSTAPLGRAVAECVAEVVRSAGATPKELDLVAASGMFTSNVGLLEVPHVLAPAGLDDIARHVVTASFPEIDLPPICLIPGIKTLAGPPTPDDLPHLDMLRGEESETFGITLATGRQGPLHVLLPGSHTKLVHVDDECRITGSYTTVAGELMQAMAERTILASSIAWPPPGEPIWPVLEAGARFAVRWGLLRGGFAVRLADVVVGQDCRERTWFFVGLVVGTDLAELARSPNWPGREPILVGGRQPLRSVYGHLLRTEWHVSAEVQPDATVELAAARGALAIARRAREIGRP